MGTIVESVNLHYTAGARSDKVYDILLEEVGPGQYTVTGYNGRRGSTLTAQPKTPSPVSFAEAKKIFDDLESGKRNSRKSPYSVVGRNSSSSTNSSPAPRATPRSTPPRAPSAPRSAGYKASHPKKISEDEAARLLESDEWYAQQKFDGVFMAVLYRGGGVTASNKRGGGVSVAPDVSAALRTLSKLAGCEISLGLAGEYLDDALHVFNVWEKNGVGLDQLATDVRLALLQRFETLYRNHLTEAGDDGPAPVRFIYTAKTREEKLRLAEDLRASDAEGLIFRHRETDVSFKWKYWEQADVIVVANEGRRSAECFVHHRGSLKSLGSVTLPDEATHKELMEATARGEKWVASVRYLYLSAPVAKGGQLVQSSFCRFRTDVEAASCTSDDLKVTNKSAVATGAAATRTPRAVRPAGGQVETRDEELSAARYAA